MGDIVDTTYHSLDEYKFTSELFLEENKTFTLSLNEIDLIVNAENLDAAKRLMAEEILDYAKDFYEEYDIWSKDLNRQRHITYIQKALKINDIDEIANSIIITNHESMQ